MPSRRYAPCVDGPSMGPERRRTLSRPRPLQHNATRREEPYKTFDTDETLKTISEKYKNITGSYSPPFLPLDKYNYKEIAHTINNSNADVVWIALGAPKQDFFAQELQKHLKNKICIGVGAAFRFSLGEIKPPPHLAQEIRPYRTILAQIRPKRAMVVRSPLPMDFKVEHRDNIFAFIRQKPL